MLWFTRRVEVYFLEERIMEMEMENHVMLFVRIRLIFPLNFHFLSLLWYCIILYIILWSTILASHKVCLQCGSWVSDGCWEF